MTGRGSSGRKRCVGRATAFVRVTELDPSLSLSSSLSLPTAQAQCAGYLLAAGRSARWCVSPLPRYACGKGRLQAWGCWGPPLVEQVAGVTPGHPAAAS